jgi:tryptophan-rich sensory protein
VIAVIGTISFNALVNILPLNGINAGAVSDYYPNLFTPPAYVFLIWGVIYVLMGIFLIYQVRASQRKESYLSEIGYLYLLGALFNIA